MNKKILPIAVIIAVIIGMAVIYFVASSGGSSGSVNKLPDHEFEIWDQNITDNAALTNESMSLFDGAEFLSYEQILEQARKGRISLVSELWKLRRNCPKDMKPLDCNLRIRQFILSKYKPPGNKELAELLTKYFRYELLMREYEMPSDISLMERYALIKKKRREIFGDEAAKLIFGLEEARTSYRAKFTAFGDDTKALSGDERMKKYEEMRKEAYGDYYDAVVEREPGFDKYRTEKYLRESDMNTMADSQKTAYVQGMRERYFGKEGAKRMAKVDEEIEQRNSKLSDYKKIEDEYLTQNSELTGDAREKKLLELRIKHLGPEEGEAYARRDRLRRYREEQKRKRGK